MVAEHKCLTLAESLESGYTSMVANITDLAEYHINKHYVYGNGTLAQLQQDVYITALGRVLAILHFGQVPREQLREQINGLWQEPWHVVLLCLAEHNHTPQWRPDWLEQTIAVAYQVIAEYQ